jgi:transitional endoplasmic reticulum ATPase
MPGYNIATVKEVLEDSKRLIVTFDTQSTVVVDDRTSDSVSPGDLVRVDNESSEVLEQVRSGGYDSGNIVGVIKRISENKVIVQTENTHLGVKNPDDLDLEKEDTVEIESISMRIIQKIENVNPPSFDLQGEEFDVDKYKTENPDDSFGDIGGLEDIKERVGEVVELPLSKSEEFEEIGAEAPSGVLFYGPPGTGKTMFARAVANSLEEGTFYNIKGPEVLNKWYGESERQLRRIFEDAGEQDGGAIIFIDEIESIASSREGSRDVDRRIVAQLLTLIDGFDDYENVSVIAATNRPEDIDQALLRPGRFDREVEFPSNLPVEDRIDILETVADSEDLNVANSVDFSTYAVKAEDWTGADLKRLLNEAAVTAIKDGRTEIRKEDLELTFRAIESSCQRKQKNTKKGEEDG